MAVSVRTTVKLVVIDSLTGYLNSMSEEQHLVLQMHEILTYLNQKSVVTILLLANHGLVGQMAAPVDLTYLCDAVLLLRFFEHAGRVRRAISVIKKRVGAHEDTIREFRISAEGVAVGQPLDSVFRIINEHSREPVESPTVKALQEGVVVGNGTDAPVEDVDPIPSFWAAISRQLPDGTRFDPDQRLSRV